MVVNKRNLPPPENLQTGNKRKINAKVRCNCVFNVSIQSIRFAKNIERGAFFLYTSKKMLPHT